MTLSKTSFWGRLPRLALTLLISAVAMFTACKKSDDASVASATDIKPIGDALAWGADMDKQMLAVIEQFIAYNTPPLPMLSPRQARMTPNIQDAVKATLHLNNVSPRQPAVSIKGMKIPSTAPDSTLVRIYTPQAGAAPYPVIVYYHGGGWVIGSLDQYEPSCLALAQNTQAIVVSVDYRLAPENKFPAAHLDAYSAYKWVVNNAASFGGSAAKVAVAGESAGGNMATGVCLIAKDSGIAQPKHQLLVYPVANNDLNTASYIKYGGPEVQPINKPSVVYFTNNYFNSPADGDSKLISLVDVADLSGLPPATIINSEIDVLQTEGQQLADRLTAAGVANERKLYAGTTHEFFGTWQAVPVANDAQLYAAQRLKAAFQ